MQCVYRVGENKMRFKSRVIMCLRSFQVARKNDVLTRDFFIWEYIFVNLFTSCNLNMILKACVSFIKPHFDWQDFFFGRVSLSLVSKENWDQQSTRSNLFSYNFFHPLFTCLHMTGAWMSQGGNWLLKHFVVGGQIEEILLMLQWRKRIQY